MEENDYHYCIYCGRTFIPTIHSGFTFNSQTRSGVCVRCNNAEMYKMDDENYSKDIMKTDE